MKKWPQEVLPLLKFNGMYLRMGIPPADAQTFKGEWIPIIFTGKKIAGSIVTGSQRMKKLLQLAADNQDFIEDMADGKGAEYVPFSEVNEAMDKLKQQKNSAYRIVLTW